MKFFLLLLLTSCASGYHSNRDGKWHNYSDVTCAEGYTVYSGQCVLLKAEIASTPPIQHQQQPVIINNILPKIDPVEEIGPTISSKGGRFEEENNGEEVSEQAMKKQIVGLMKKVMLSSAKRAIMEQEGNIKIATPNVIGTVELGKSSVSVGSGMNALNADYNEGISDEL